MKIRDILTEGKFAKSVYAYHATYKKYLKSILKHGLIPNRNEGGYGSDEVSDIGYSKAPMDGVYFTYSRQDAKSIATSLHTTSPVIIVMKVQKRASVFDEDELVGPRGIDERALIKIITTELKTKDISYTDVQYSPEENEDFLNSLHNLLYSNIHKRVEDKLSKKIADHVSNDIDGYVSNIIDIYFEFNNQDDTEIRNHINNLSKKLRMMYHKNTSIERGRVVEPITFSGASRIVGVYDIETNTSWGDVGGFQGQSYNAYDSPMKLLKTPVREGFYKTDIKNSQGDIDLVKDIKYSDHIGSGNFAIATRDQDPHMINKIEKPPSKMFYTSAYKAFVDWIINNDVVRNNPHFPRIYEVDTVNNSNKEASRYKIEKLIPIHGLNTTQTASLLLTSIGESNINIDYELGGILKECIEKGTVQDRFTKTLKDAILMLHKFTVQNNMKVDLPTSNMMARITPHGVQLVFTDPFYG